MLLSKLAKLYSKKGAFAVSDSSLNNVKKKKSSGSTQYGVKVCTTGVGCAVVC